MPSPTVTAIMITGRLPRRNPRLVQAALRSFQQQTYAARQLLIVNTGDLLTLPADDRIRQLPADPALPLGALRNLALQQVTTPWVIQWDDDDYQHPRRIAWQLTQTLAAGAPASVLRWQLRYSFTFNTAGLVHAVERGHHGSLLFRYRPQLRYPPLARAEDTEFLRQGWSTAETLSLENTARTGYAHLQLRCEHGANTWPAAHILPAALYGETQRDCWDLPPRVAEYLEALLRREYSLPAEVRPYLRGS